MIRFVPDGWIEALLRFLAMAAPDGNVYVEIAAPDLRFAALVLLALGVVMYRRRLSGNPRPALALLVLLLVSTVPWLATTGNGRYWIPMLLCVGPLAVGLISLLPLTRAFRLFLAATLLAAQTFVVLNSAPWGAWSWLEWREPPYFQVTVPAIDGTGGPTTFVTLSSISYSLIAPRFPPSSRWINISSGDLVKGDSERMAQFLASARKLELIAPSVGHEIAADGQPSPELRRALDVLLSAKRLALEPGAGCEFLPSPSLAAIDGRYRPMTRKEAANYGFWMCPLRYPVDRPRDAEAAPSARVEAAFQRVEQLCPRFFRPGEAKTIRINGGALRQYTNSDMKVYILDDGQVLYKYWRALNPVLIGTIDAVLDGSATVQCDRIRGRGGLPWEREI